MKHKRSSGMQIRAFDYEVKAADDSGKFSGYGSVFGVVDSYKEIVAPGAFAESLADLRAKNRSLPVLWQHRTAEPIGDWDMSTMIEDTIGLKGDGTLWLDDAPYARIAMRGMKARAITGLSIGYFVRDESYDQKTGIATLKKLDLVEISIVTNPANDEARIDTIKSKLAHGGLPSLPEFEQLLREAGFSKTQSAVIANRGLKHLLDRGEPGSAQLGDVLKQLNSFTLNR
jgi:HK97 family phage prohead protease